MKFPIVAGFILAGLTSSKLTQSQMKKVDEYLRQNDQNLNSKFRMEGFKINERENAQISYKSQNNHQSKTFEVKQQKGHFEIVGRSNSVQYGQLLDGTNSLLGNIFGSINLFNNPMIPPPPPVHPRPFFMPSFQVLPNHPPMNNLFQPPNQIKQLQQRMKIRQKQLQRRMKLNQENIKNSFLNNFQNNNEIFMRNGFQKMPMMIIGSNNNNVWNDQFNNQLNGINNMELRTPILIGGNSHDNWEQKILQQRSQPLIGGGDHDLGVKKENNNNNKLNKNQNLQKINEIKQNLFNNFIKPIQKTILKSSTNNILENGQKLVGDTLNNLRNKFLKSQKSQQQLKSTLNHLILPQVIEQAIQLPNLLGGETDPDHYIQDAKEKVQKLIKQNKVIDQVINKITGLIHQKEEKSTINKKEEQKKQQIKDIDQDQTEQIPENSKKLQPKIK